MRKFIIILLLLFINQVIYSQDTNTVYTIQFTNSNKLSVIEELETISKYKFYYQDNWLENNVLITGNYTNKTITEILHKILEDTNINFIIDKNRIILIKNSIIHTKLPENYFEKQSNDNHLDNNLNEPIFFQQYDTIKKSESETASIITLVGKESTYSNDKLYTLSGYLKNSKSGKPLVDISLKVKNTDINTTTNADGYYTLQLPYCFSPLNNRTKLYI